VCMCVCVCACVCVHEEHMSVCLRHVTRRVRMWQVKWGKGSATNPHVVVLEAGLDSLDFDEDLPLAPWL
jgi:hypothetical protein